MEAFISTTSSHVETCELNWFIGMECCSRDNEISLLIYLPRPYKTTTYLFWETIKSLVIGIQLAEYDTF